MSLTQGRSAVVSATLKRSGVAVPFSLDAVITAALYSADGAVPLGPTKTLLPTAHGADWASGVVVAVFTEAETSVLSPPAAVVRFVSTVDGVPESWRITVPVDVEPSDLVSHLFPVKALALSRMRRDRLVLASRSVLPPTALSDDYLWDKLRAAESEIAHELRVPLAPTTFLPLQPTDEEIAALDGKPWGIDPGYDYSPEAFGYNDKWGMIKLRNKPLKSVSRVRFAYPGGQGSSYDLPLDWLRMDKKYGTIQFVPSSTAFVAPLNAFVMQAIGNGRTIPLAIQISYVAGLENVAATFPELLDVVLKKAVIKIMEDALLPQSGSISADGLSQSMSVDMDKYHDAIDRIINGGKGSNGGLMTAIHGVRIGVLGV